MLQEILAAKQREVAEARSRRPLAALEAAARARVGADPPRGFRARLVRPSGQPVRVIAEVKRGSPSAGPIRPDADPRAIGREYEAAGAAAISVLTDKEFFLGELGFLTQVREAVRLPLLRKDFLVDPYQVVEAVAAGADAVLLIVAALDDARLGELMAVARQWGLDALVEAHSQDEAGRALDAGADLLGVNHRDLATLAMDMGLTARIRAQVPEHVVLVGESGIRSAADVAALGRQGVDAVLVGEHLMAAPSPGQALAALLEPVP